MVHPYFVEKARRAFVEAGGNPDNATALAEWAENANSLETPPHGCIVSKDGEILAETEYSRAAQATYVVDTGRFDVRKNVLDLAMAQIAKEHGADVAHIKLSQFTGAR